VSTLGKVPILEITAASRAKHQRAQIAGDRRHSQNQLGESVFMARIFIVEHEMTARRDLIRQHLNDAGFETLSTRIARAIVEFYDRISPAFEPRLNTASTAADYSGDERAARCFAT